MRLALVLVAASALLAACQTGPKPDAAATATAPDSVRPSATPAASAITVASATASAATGALHLGAPIEGNAPAVALSDVAKTPDTFMGKTFTTTGTVTAVCQHMGCWMEIKDDASEAHIKMAGHAFFVPKTASGHKARVLATLSKAPEAACEGAGHDEKHGKGKGCRAEAEAQLGRPLAKLELVAQGVELN